MGGRGAEELWRCCCCSAKPPHECSADASSLSELLQRTPLSHCSRKAKICCARKDEGWRRGIVKGEECCAGAACERFYTAAANNGAGGWRSGRGGGEVHGSDVSSRRLGLEVTSVHRMMPCMFTLPTSALGNGFIFIFSGTSTRVFLVL